MPAMTKEKWRSEVRALVEYFYRERCAGLVYQQDLPENVSYQSVADRKLVLEEVMAVAKEN